MEPIRLEALAESHLDAVAALVDDPDVQRFTRVPVPAPAGFPSAWFGMYEEGRRDGTREAFAIVDGGSEFLGLALAPRIDRDSRTVELGYVVAPAARGRGVASRALAVLTEWAMDHVGAERCELLISVENGASKRVAERCGYVREGVLRSLHVRQDLREDTEIWSRLPSDA